MTHAHPVEHPRRHPFALPRGMVRARRVEPDELPTWREIIQWVAAKHGLRVADVIGRSKKRPCAWARQEAAWLLRQQPAAYHPGNARWSYPRIAPMLGWTDHTTVMFAVRRHQERLDQSKA